MIDLLASAIVTATGLFLISLGVASLVVRVGTSAIMLLVSTVRR
jgi:hypothetical protein